MYNQTHRLPGPDRYLKYVNMDCLVCPLCNNQFVDPQELECLHVFCKECIERDLLLSQRDGVVVCRLCSQETASQSITKSRVMELALEATALGHSDEPKDEDGVHEIEGLACELRQELLSITNSESDLSHVKKTDIVEKITNFYQNLIVDLTNYLKEQSSDTLAELEALFDGYERERFVKNGMRERLAGSVESLCKLFSKIYTTRNDTVMDELKQETVRFLSRCRGMISDVGSVQCNVKFLPGDEQRDLVLVTNFGALLSTTVAQEPETNVTHEGGNVYEERMENVLETVIPRHDSVESPSEMTSTEQLLLDVTNSTQETITLQPVISETPPNSNNGSSNEREGNQTESEVRQDQIDQSVIGTPAVANDAGSATNSTEQMVQPASGGLIGPNNTDAYPEEQPPSYWEAISETEAPQAGSVSPQAFIYNGREGPPQYSPRQPGSFSSGVPSRPSQRNRISQNSRVNLPTLNTVHTSYPLQYATHTRSIRTQLPDDVRSGPIVGIAWMQDKLVLVDRFNSKIKLFKETGEFLHSLKFVDDEPWDVCAVNVIETFNYPSTCAATVPRQRLIMIIQIAGGRTLLINHRIATRKGYACIAYDQKNGCIVCGVSSPFGTSGIDVINTAGVLLAQYPLPPRVLVRSIDVSIKDTIIISDWRKNNITFLSKTGTAISHYSGSEQCPLVEPVGTCTDGRGFLFVADSKSNTIHILTMEGTLYGTVKSSCPIIRPKEINVRLDGPPMLAVSHGSMYVEIFNLFESSQANPTTTPSAPAIHA